MLGMPLTSAWINATTKVVIGTCASGATNPELCNVCVLSVDRIYRIVVTFLLSEEGYHFELFFFFFLVRVFLFYTFMHVSFRLANPPH